MRYVSELIETTLDTVNKYRTVSTIPCGDFYYKECGYKTDNNIPEIDDTWEKWPATAQFSGLDKHFWVRGTIKTPDSIPEDTYLVLECARRGANPQTILYLNGKMMQGLDGNHSTARIECGKEYDVVLYIYFDGVNPGDAMIRPCMKIKSKKVEKAYFDMQVPFEAAKCFDTDAAEKKLMFKHLEIACLMIDKTHEGRKEFFDSLEAADEYMIKEFYEKECGKGDLVVSCLGHSHIDIAWRWTVDQTKEKAQRSFGTVLQLMKEYPEFLFMMSQPQLYEFLKTESPELYQELKERVKEGRWEVEGAMWLESDCNIPSGESFVRQLIRGKKFIRDEFGKESKTLWIPDVFGYSAALPQILKKAGVENFVTGKISWCDVNSMPNDTFYWKGIDGTEIFTHFLTTKDFNIHTWFPEKTHEYVMFNGMLDPREVKSTYDVYRTKTWNSETLHTFGFGDGGGGPTYEMLERYRRLQKGLPGIPKTQMSTLDDFLARIKDNFDDSCKKLRETPRWDGELYLEYHRGTYTSIAQIKRNNRKAEFALRKAETLAVMDELFFNNKYDSEAFDSMWKLMCLNQFHDIIPGSAIEPVYKRSNEEYGRIFDGTGNIIGNSIKNIAENVKSDGGILVYNMNSHEGKGVVEYDGGVYTTENIPPMGYAVVDSLYSENHAVITENSIENEYFRIKFNDMGYMESIYDKREDRELLRKGELGNELLAYEDYPYHWDAWELSHYTRLKPHPMDELVSAVPYRNGAAAGITFTWKFMDSTIKQDVVVYDNIPRIDVLNDIDMKQIHVLIKALFPFDVRTTKTVSEIQYGHTERPYHMNTSWDEAKFETCMHKWVDVSDNGYGVSLLNDCKYGFSSYNNTLALTLLKSPESPYYKGDCRQHKFTYSIYPHHANAALGGTVEEAYRLNAPLTAVNVAANKNGALPDRFSMVTCNCDNITVEVLKKAENNDGIVVRLYDAHNMVSKPTLKFGFPVKEAYITNLLEEEPVPVEVKDNSVTVNVGTFEIITLLLK